MIGDCTPICFAAISNKINNSVLGTAPTNMICRSSQQRRR